MFRDDQRVTAWVWRCEGPGRGKFFGQDELLEKILQENGYDEDEDYDDFGSQYYDLHVVGILGNIKKFAERNDGELCHDDDIEDADIEKKEWKGVQEDQSH